MKKLILFASLCFFIYSSFAQSDDKPIKENKGFKKENLFTGGSANVGFSSLSTSLGITPQFGYSLARWADIGLTLNLDYTSQRDYQFYGDKLRQTVYGPGAFVRLFPINFLFATAQYEYNFIHLKYIPEESSGLSTKVNNLNGSSLLVGGGYAGGRERGNNTYYFLSVMWDILGDKNSPYIDGLGRSIPIIRAGYNIGLFQGHYRR